MSAQHLLSETPLHSSEKLKNTEKVGPRSLSLRAIMSPFDHRELVRHQPVIIIDLVEIDQPDLVALDLAVVGCILDIDALRSVLEGRSSSDATRTGWKDDLC